MVENGSTVNDNGRVSSHLGWHQWHILQDNLQCCVTLTFYMGMYFDEQEETNAVQLAVAFISVVMGL